MGEVFLELPKDHQSVPFQGIFLMNLQDLSKLRWKVGLDMVYQRPGFEGILTDQRYGMLEYGHDLLVFCDANDIRNPPFLPKTTGYTGYLPLWYPV